VGTEHAHLVHLLATETKTGKVILFSFLLLIGSLFGSNIAESDIYMAANRQMAKLQGDFGGEHSCFLFLLVR
jgi:hypothetical protein